VTGDDRRRLKLLVDAAARGRAARHDKVFAACRGCGSEWRRTDLRRGFCEHCARSNSARLHERRAA
jgi:hypothetical protein